MSNLPLYGKPFSENTPRREWALLYNVYNKLLKLIRIDLMDQCYVYLIFVMSILNTQWTDPKAVRDLKGRSMKSFAWRGRKGWVSEEVGQQAVAVALELQRPIGSLTWWFLPREDFATSVATEWMTRREPKHGIYTLLGDKPGEEAWKNPEQNHFSVVYCRGWYDQFQVKWHHGPVWGPLEENAMFFHGREKAYAGLGHLNLHRGHWMQLGLSWDEKGNDYRVYLNGCLVQTALTTAGHPLLRAKTSGMIYAGHPLFGCGELQLYDRRLTAAEFAGLYANNRPEENEDVDAALVRTFAGPVVKDFDWKPDSDWKEHLSLPLTRPEDLSRFYLQGMTEAVSVSSEGMSLRTSPLPVSARPDRPKDWADPGKWASNAETWDQSQVYVWLEDALSGDFAVEFDFMTRQPHGLALIMVRAAGLQGEDFFRTQPRRKSGSMRMVCWENVRNYHWEFYRVNESSRTDTADHVLVKNPYLHPMAYRAMSELLEVGRWHRLQFVHEGNSLRGAVNGTLVFEVEDDPFAGFGPVLRNGAFALRCMWGSDMVFRNLRLLAKPDPY
jgi:hypothetical protein